MARECEFTENVFARNTDSLFISVDSVPYARRSVFYLLNYINGTKSHIYVHNPSTKRDRKLL